VTARAKKQVACIILNFHLKCSGEDVDLNLFTGAMISQRRFLERFPTELLIQEMKWFLAALAESRIKWPNPLQIDIFHDGLTTKKGDLGHFQQLQPGV